MYIYIYISYICIYIYIYRYIYIYDIYLPTRKVSNQSQLSRAFLSSLAQLRSGHPFRCCWLFNSTMLMSIYLVVMRIEKISSLDQFSVFVVYERRRYLSQFSWYWKRNCIRLCSSCVVPTHKRYCI